MASLDGIYDLLLSEYGPQGWWPLCVNGEMKYFVTEQPNPEQQFEICVGAVLAQNTAWTNAGRAVLNLHNMGLLSPEKIIEFPELGEAIKPSGYFRQKAEALRGFSEYFLKNKDPYKRESLLSVKRIGEETADSILLYAAGERSGIGDAYARRILSRYGFGRIDTYSKAKEILEEQFSGDTKEMKELHALLVEHAKVSCRKSSPRCFGCALRKSCAKNI